MNTSQLNSLASEVRNHISELKGRKVLIVGDVGVDEYIWGDVKRISPEAPVPVVDVNRQDARLGLSANVAANVASLGGEALLVGVVGDDAGRNNLCSLLKDHQVSSDHLIVDKDRPTTRKIRIMAAEHQQIVRVDFEKKKFLSALTSAALVDQVGALMDSVDIVLLEDYAKGVLSEEICQKIIKLSHSKNKKVLVDPHRITPLSYYKGVDLFKPNRDEAIILSGLNFDELREPDDMMEIVAKTLKQKVQCKDVIITLGKKGVLIYSQDEFSYLPTFAKDVFDVTGAGDTVIASIGLGVASGWPLHRTSAFANFAAGIVVGKVGCAPCDLQELLDSLEQ